jgi:hypothetical protein
MAMLCMAVIAGSLKAQTIPTPKEHFGFNIGDDYQLANYTQTEAYFKKLAASPKVKMVDMGLTEEGRHQWMLVISSAENIKKLNTYKDIAQKLARAEGLTDAEAKALAKQGKVVVWVDGGLHANETVGAHQLIETAYQLITRTDEETQMILDRDIILMVHANPDGQEIISNWYMQQRDVKKRNMSIPRLYEKYIGHDNNRDFYMMNTKESQNITRQQYLEWLPQIVYNHHQTGPAGSIVAGPPFRDPFNYVFDPLLVTSLDAVGSAMNSRLNREGKPGYTQRNGTEFSTWWNGGLRTATYFHNMVGLLTEIVGGPTPATIPLVPDRLIPNSGTPFPVTPQSWHFRQSIDYSVSLNYAVFTHAARYSDDMLYNTYIMAKNSIDRGSQDYWTLSPKRADAIKQLYAKSQLIDTAARRRAAADSASRGGNRAATAGAVTIGGRGGNLPVRYFDSVLRKPELRDPRGYIITANQPDFGTAVRFVNTCIRSGLVVHKASAAFTVAGVKYPSGSYIIKTNQAFRPEVLDRFEPQDHPNDFLYPGGPPIRPYDMTGWTLAYQMGVKFDRILDDFNGPFVRIPYGQLQDFQVSAAPSLATKGYFIKSTANNSFIAVNDLLQNGVEVHRLTKGDKDNHEGDFYIPYSVKAKTVLAKAASLLNVSALAASNKPKNTTPVKPARIALWDVYGGSMPSGWTRWLMEQYHFPFKQVYAQEFDAGNLKDKYDVIVFVGGAIPAPGSRPITRTDTVPDEFKHMTGRLSSDKSIPQLKAFLEAGGNIVTVGSSVNLAYQLKLPVRSALADSVNGRLVPFPGDKFYVPGAVLRVAVDNCQPAAWGMPAEADVLYDNSPVFKFAAGAEEQGVKPLLWFATDTPLRSGWAWGQKYLKDGVAAFSAPVGKGMLYSFGPEITFRGQSHGTFKLLFNQLYVNK